MMFRPVLEVTESPAPLRGWESADAGDAPGGALEVLERDLCCFMREAAELRMEVTAANERHRLEMERVLLGYVSVLDGFGRVFRSIASKQDQIDRLTKIWINNFRAVSRIVEQLLEDQGVVPITNLAQGFDPRWHRVGQVVEDPSQPDGAIVEELKPGYLWQGRVLRKTEVAVIRHEDGEPSDRDSEALEA